MPKAVLLDTSFFLRFLKENDPLFKHADGYYRYFLEKDYSLVISTITVAEFCVMGSIDELPLKNLQVLPFNLNHTKRTGEFAKILFEARAAGKIDFAKRAIIPNDSKLFAQADTEPSVEYFLTSDSESQKSYNILKGTTNPHFKIIDIHRSHSETFGILDL